MFTSWKDTPVKEPVKGVKMRVITAEKVQMVLFEIDPNCEIPEHSHPHEQMGTVLEGKILLRINGEEKILEKGDAYIAPSNVPHGAKALDEGAVVLDVFSPPREEYR